MAYQSRQNVSRGKGNVMFNQPVGERNTKTKIGQLTNIKTLNMFSVSRRKMEEEIQGVDEFLSQGVNNLKESIPSVDTNSLGRGSSSMDPSLLDPEEWSQRENFAKAVQIIMKILGGIWTAMRQYRSNVHIKDTWTCLVWQTSVFEQMQNTLLDNQVLAAILTEPDCEQKFKDSLEYICDNLKEVSKEVTYVTSYLAEPDGQTLKQRNRGPKTRTTKRPMSKSKQARNLKKDAASSTKTRPPEQDIIEWSERLAKKMKTSREVINKFAEDCNQICTKIAKADIEGEGRSFSNSETRLQILGEFECAQNASRVLYLSLCDHCHLHQSHIVDFNFEASHTTDHGVREVEFNLALRLDQNLELQQEESLWLQVKAMHTSYSSDSSEDSGTLSAQQDTATSRRGSFNYEGLRMCLIQGSKFATSQPCIPSEPEFIGTLGLHKLYSSPKVPSNPHGAISLGTIIRMHHTHALYVSESERLELAKLITRAVLQFCCTPWLRGFWNSEDVVFFSREDEPLSDPHFRVRLVRPQSLETMSNVDANKRVLFSLGIVLFQLWTLTVNMKPDSWYGADAVEDIRNHMSSLVSMKRLPPRYEQAVCSCIRENMGNLQGPTVVDILYGQVFIGLVEAENEWMKPLEDLFPCDMETETCIE